MGNRLRQLSEKLNDMFVSHKDLLLANSEFAQARPSALFADWHIAASRAHEIGALKELPDITICAVTLNSERWLDAFLASLCRLSYPKNKLSIHFVDHGSTDETLIKLNSFAARDDRGFLSVRIDERPNAGYGAGNDYAIRRAADDFVLVTNVDVEFCEDSLKTIASVAVRDIPRVASWEFRQSPYEHPKYYDPVTHLSGWASHACVLLRKSAYLEVGGYHKDIFMYGEDVELSYRFRNAGWMLRYVPKAVITHHVDLQDLSARPHQLSGSIAANSLLRRQYGTRRDRFFGRVMIWFLRMRLKDFAHKKAFQNAEDIYKAKRSHFRPVPVKQPSVKFQFHKFDYGFRRAGATLAFKPADKLKVSNAPSVGIFIAFQDTLDQAFMDTVTTALNQTYSKSQCVIICETETADTKFFKSLKTRYVDKIKYVSPAQMSSDLTYENFKYMCGLDSGDQLFADHIELLTQALENKEVAVAAQSEGWKSNGDSRPSEKYMIRTDFLKENGLFGDIAATNLKIFEISEEHSELFILVPKTTSITRPAT